VLAEREPIGKMVAEVLREIGLLLLTFMPLDTALERSPVPAPIFWSGMLWGLEFILLGIILERKRK
jgi:hypothetical protein